MAGLRRDLVVGTAVLLPILVLLAIVVQTLLLAVGVGARIVGTGRVLGLEGTLAAAGFLLVVVLAVPLVLVGVGRAIRHRYGSTLVGTVDRAIERVPGLGPIYRGLRRSRDAIADPDAETFREVVAVELAEGVTALGFLVDRPGTGGGTRDADDRDSADRDDEEFGDENDQDRPGAGDSSATDGAEPTPGGVTVYLPFAPNPTVGGHLLTVQPERIHPTDLTVGEALGVLVGLGAGEAGPSEGEPEREPPLGSFYDRTASAERD